VPQPNDQRVLDDMEAPAQRLARASGIPPIPSTCWIEVATVRDKDGVLEVTPQR